MVNVYNIPLIILLRCRSSKTQPRKFGFTFCIENPDLFLNYRSHHLLSFSLVFLLFPFFLVFLLAAPLSLRTCTTCARRENECTLEPAMEDHHPTVSFRVLTKEPGEACFRGSIGVVEKMALPPLGFAGGAILPVITVW